MQIDAVAHPQPVVEGAEDLPVSNCSFSVLGCARVSTAASESEGLSRFASWLASQWMRSAPRR